MIQQVAVFVAGALTAITGFGFNALSLPVLVIVFEPHHAVVVGLLVGLLVFALVLVLPGVRGAVDARLVWTLFAWSLIGLPIGAAILVRLDDRALRVVVGSLTVLYAVGQLFGWLPTLPASRRAASGVGVVSGIFSSAVSMGGTVVILYLLGLGGTPRELRATAVAYVLLSTVASLVTLSFTGLVTWEAVTDAALLAPATVVGFGIGAFAFRHVTRSMFVRLTLVALAVVGIFALVAGLT